MVVTNDTSMHLTSWGASANNARVAGRRGAIACYSAVGLAGDRETDRLEGPLSIVLAVLALGVLITFHEFGHYWVARRMGMRVERFSIGFGPALTSWRRGDTEFVLSAVPLGGYVKIAGMAPEDEVELGDKGNYANKPAWQRLLVIIAGPAANYLLAFVVGVGLLATWHHEPNMDWTVLGEVDKNMPAGKAGLQRGDEVVLVDGVEVHAFLPMRVEIASAAKRHPNEPFPFVIRRKDALLTFQVQPENDNGNYKIGVGAADKDVAPLPFGPAVSAAAANMVRGTRESANMIVNLLHLRGLKDMGGPPQMVQQLSEQAKKSFVDLLSAAGGLSLGVGFINMMPLPGLDGGRFMFLAYEVVTRRRMNQKIESVIHAVGIILLLTLIVVVSARGIIF